MSLECKKRNDPASKSQEINLNFELVFMSGSVFEIAHRITDSRSKSVSRFVFFDDYILENEEYEGNGYSSLRATNEYTVLFITHFFIKVSSAKKGLADE